MAYHVEIARNAEVELEELYRWVVARAPQTEKATFRRDRRLNIRLSSKDPEAIQTRALAEGFPYQTLMSSLLHTYSARRLKEL